MAGPAGRHDAGVVTSELVADLVLAQRTNRAVVVTLHEDGRLPEPMGVAEVKAEHGWAEFYKADAFGAEDLVRFLLDAIASLSITDVEWNGELSA